MEDYEYVYDYKNNDLLRNSFFSLADKTFKLEFNKWYEKGFWYESYICHSLVHDGQIISNVSITKMNLIIDSKEVKAIQIGTVMTHPEYRMKGLVKKLMDKILLKYSNEYPLMYLFPNESLMEFYPKFGFQLTSDYLFSIEINTNNCTGKKAEKMDCDNHHDLDKIIEIISSRIPRSLKFDCLYSKSIFLWYCLNAFKDKHDLIQIINMLIIKFFLQIR